MAARGDKTLWVVALLAAALGSGAFGRYLLGTATDGLLFAAAVAAGIVLLGLPLLLAEASLGQFRRRNVADAFGPGPWSAAGWGMALAALLLAAYLATVAGWSARLAYGAFQGDYGGDADRHLRLVTQGADAMLLALAAIATAVGLAISGARRGLRTPMAGVAIAGLVAVAGLAGYAFLQADDDARDGALRFGLEDLDGRLVVSALQQALVPAFLGVGVVATLSARVHDRTLPREATVLALAWILIPAAIGFALAALAATEGVVLGDGFAIDGALRLFVAIGGTAGGVLAGTFFGLLLAGSLAALVAVLEVPATVLAERLQVGEARANVAAGLAAYLLAIPMAFLADWALEAELLLAAVVAPLAGLAVAVHVGWLRPQVLDGFVVGDARHRLDRLLRPVLRYVLPLPLLALLVLGAMQVAVDVFGAEAGSGGLWRLVP